VFFPRLAAIISTDEFRPNNFRDRLSRFIAERLVKRLARREAQFFLLVQKPFIEKAMRRIEEIAGIRSAAGKLRARRGRHHTKESWNFRRGFTDYSTETTDVHHLAAVYDLSVAKDTAHSVNVEGTRNVNEIVGI
jgi:hypothetical protein